MCIRDSTGTNAMEAALKLARKVTGRTNVFALMGCFHGMSLGALAMTTDEAARKGAGIPLENVTHIPAPYMFPELDTIQYMETLLEDCLLYTSGSVPSAACANLRAMPTSAPTTPRTATPR